MRQPQFHHLTGSKAWLQCDHQCTQLDVANGTVKLSYRKIQDGQWSSTTIDIDDWQAARGGGVFHYFPPDDCQKGSPLVLNRQNGELYLLDKGSGWVSLYRKTKTTHGKGDEVPFFDRSDSYESRFKFKNAAKIISDHCGNYWILDQRRWRIIRLSSEDFTKNFEENLPTGTKITDLAATNWGLVAIDAADNTLSRFLYEDGWETVVLDSIQHAHSISLQDYQPVCISGGSGNYAIVLLRPRSQHRRGFWIAIVDKDTIGLFQLEDVHNPWPIFLLPNDHFLVGEIQQPRQKQKKTVFKRFWLDITNQALELKDQWVVWGYDGRGLYLDHQGDIFATTEKGVLPISLRHDDFETEGQVETFALDSKIFGCQWHRIFVDVCLPNRTGLKIAARTSDELPPEEIRRIPNPPNNTDRLVDPWIQYPLGSLSADDGEQWLDLGQLDRRAAHADVVFSPIFNAPLDDNLILPKLKARSEFQTLEGLIKNPSGRYLWLRLKIFGTHKKSPILHAVRATYQRPSLLEHLPGYWRADPAATRLMDQVLALFEGHITEIDQRLEDMRHLFSARVCPKENLDWLASFVALNLDTRLRESVQRRLLIEMTRLYRQRGTLPGLERLLSILAEADVTILESYRLRGHNAAFIGASSNERAEVGRSVIDHDLRLGGYESGPGAETHWEPWEIELMQNYRPKKKHWELQKQIFDESGLLTDAPCPERKPQEPIDQDPFIAFHRRYAHRFSVLIFREKDETLADIMEQAIESNKPAHTLHRLCWLDAGFRLGSNAYLGVGTKITKTEDFQLPVLNQATLAGHHILG